MTNHRDHTSARRHRRLPLLARVTQRSGQTTYWRAITVSNGGICVRAAPTLPLGTLVEVAFFVPTCAREIVERARVVWRNDATTPGYDNNLPFGMGLEFVAISASARACLDSYVVHFDPDLPPFIPTRASNP